MTKDMREGVVAAFDALSHWRDEIETANERCLGKVLDQTSAVARSMGWPDQAIRTTREYLENTSKMQLEMIDHITDTWKQQLKSATGPMSVPRSFSGQASGLSAAAFSPAKPEFSAFAPWTFWLQAARCGSAPGCQRRLLAGICAHTSLVSLAFSWPLVADRL